MNDIPIGSPPVPPGRHAAPGGWYPDPVDATQERYWDGWQWSRNTRPRESALPGRPILPVHLGGAGYSANQPYQQNPYQQNPYQQNPYDQGPHQQSPYQQGQQPAPYRPAPLGGTAQAAYTADGVTLSGWWWRVLAAYIDGVIVGLLVVIPSFPIYQRLFSALSAYFVDIVRAAQAGQANPPQLLLTDVFTARDQLTLTAIQLAVALVYHIVFLRWKAATPGKLICGLRVVPVDRGRSTGPLAWAAIVIRALIWVLPGASGYLAVFRLLDGLFPLWQPKRQALHDLAAKTQVVRIRR